MQDTLSDLSPDQLDGIYGNLWAATHNLINMMDPDIEGLGACDALATYEIQDSIQNAISATSYYTGHPVGSPELEDIMQSREFWNGFDDYLDYTQTRDDIPQNDEIGWEIAESHIRSEVADRVDTTPDPGQQHCPAPGFAPQ